MSDPRSSTNALGDESSPYLRLHRHNPVDWYPWGDVALRRAREEDRPIFLSIGYSTCYWCHVMERESFSSPAIAELMNREFVNIKVDREERPELDEIYMVATQVLTHQGGWPNSVFLTPELKPFFAGTYFPPEDRHGRPGFATVLSSLADAWQHRRGDVLEQSESVFGAIRHYLEDRDAPTVEPPGVGPAERSLRSLERQFDPQWGGFGGAPKFPAVPNLLLLEEFVGAESDARRMLDATLDQMARGGIYDQLAGGFHRYATDREWRIPHFEKMLYDNGLLLELYARDFERGGREQSERIVRETAGFLAAEMTAPDGGLWSAIDAETDGVEGAYYVWRREEIVEVLGREDAAFLAPLLGFEGAPFFDGERYVLHWPSSLAAQAERRRIDPAALHREIRPLLDRLLEARSGRERPATDDKILADWNGIAIAGLAEASRVLGDAQIAERAGAALDFVLATLRSPSGVLLHAWRAGVGRVEAFLSDYVFLVRAALALHRAGGEARWITAALELAEEQERRLAAPEGGYFAAAASDDVLVRSRDVYDGALPAANGVAVLNLLELASTTGDERWEDLARRALCAHGGLLERQPEAARVLAAASRRAVDGGPAAAEATTDRTERLTEPGDPSRPDEIVQAALHVEAAADDGWRGFELELRIGRGWHVYAHQQSLAWVHRTELQAEGVELEGVEYPPGEEGAEGVAFYRDLVSIVGRLRPVAATAVLTVSLQPCDETRCLAPIALDIELSPARPENDPNGR